MAATEKKLVKRRMRLMKLQDRAQLLLSFGRRLEQLRLRSGLTPSQFEAKSGIDAGNLAKYEQGLREPGLILIVLMARTLEVSLQELFDFDFDESTNVTIRRNNKHLTHDSVKDPVVLLRSLMKERNMKSKDLVKILGLSKGLVSEMLNHKKGLSKQSIRILADYFGIDVSLLLGNKS